MAHSELISSVLDSPGIFFAEKANTAEDWDLFERNDIVIQRKNSKIIYIALFAMMFNIMAFGMNAKAVAENLVPGVIVNGQSLTMDVPPIVDNGRIMVPMRAICEALGAAVEWTDGEQRVSAVRAGSTVTFVLGQTQAFKDGESIEMDVVPRVENERVLVPLRFISQALGADVDWNGDTYNAIINLNQESISPASTTIIPDNARVFNTAGTYGPSSGKDVLDTNVSIQADGVALQNMSINGDLYVAREVGEGSVELNNVDVTGNVYVFGGGAHSVEFNDCDLNSVVIDKEGVRIVSSGSTSINLVTLESGAILVEISGGSGQGFQQIIVSSGSKIILEGIFSIVNIDAANAHVELLSGSVQSMITGAGAAGTQITVGSSAVIKSMTLNSACSVLGTGLIDQANINVQGCSFQTTPQSVINSSVTATSSSDSSGTSTNTSSISISSVETNNTFGGFRFTTSKAVTEADLTGKIKAGSITVTSFEQRGACNGTEWKGLAQGVVAGQSYAITCLSPFTMANAASLSWDLVAPPVTGLTASCDASGKIKVDFDKADGENRQVSEYRVFAVKSGSSLGLNKANSTAADRYTTVSCTNAASYSTSLAAGSKDSDGNLISAGNSYVIYVLTVANGTDAKTNCLTGPSQQVDIPAAPGSSGDGGPSSDTSAPVFAAGYPNISGITSSQALLNGQINEAGTLYYVVLADGALAPSANQVCSGKDKSGAFLSAPFAGNLALTANVAASATLSGLASSTSYDVYVVAKDATNQQATPTKLDFGSASPAPVAAQFSSAIVTDSGDISISFSKDLKTPLPAEIYKKFTLSDATISVTSVEITGNSQMKLVLSTKLIGGQNVSVSFNQPTQDEKKLKDIDGLPVEVFANQPVTNSLALPIAPVLTRAVATPEGDISLLFDKAMQTANLAGMAGQFSVNSGAISVSSVEVTGVATTIKLVLASKITPGQTAIVSYVKSAESSNQLKDTTGASVENIADHPVDVFPVLLAIEVTSKGDLSLQYNKALNTGNFGSLTGCFIVKIAGASDQTPTVESTSTSGKIKLTLDTKIVSGQTVTLTYNKPVDLVNQLQDMDTLPAAAFTDIQVPYSL